MSRKRVAEMKELKHEYSKVAVQTNRNTTISAAKKPARNVSRATVSIRETTGAGTEARKGIVLEKVNAALHSTVVSSILKNLSESRDCV